MFPISLLEKAMRYRAGVVDIGLTKIAVAAAVLLVAKWWAPVLSLDWRWYLTAFLLAVVRPLFSLFKALKV